jgi:hypothetical protein
MLWRPGTENFHGMVNKALVLKDHKAVMEHKHKLVRQHQLGSGSRPHAALSLATHVFHSTKSQMQQRPQSARQGFMSFKASIYKLIGNVEYLIIHLTISIRIRLRLSATPFYRGSSDIEYWVTMTFSYKNLAKGP